MARPAPDEVYRGVTRIFATIIAGFGVVIFVVTLANGGGPLSAGFWLGILFTAVGLGRLYLAIRTRD